MIATINQIEWGSSDVERLKEFVSALFGWVFAPLAPGYYFYRGADGPGIALMQNERCQAGGTPNVYVRVASIAECLAKAPALGGGVAVPETPIPGMGSFAFIKAPDGNLIGLHQLETL
jgi:predicted enzyme related to lactoylglutathione lyase